jgi:hypothetical protein
VSDQAFYEGGLRRNVIEMSMSAKPLAPLYVELYNVQSTFIYWIDNWAAESDFPELPPMLSLAKDTQHKWLGQYANIGPFGFKSVITLNVAMFAYAHQMLPTLAHEIAHWAVEKGHGDLWKRCCQEVFGLTYDSNGVLVSKANQWQELMDGFELESVLRRIHL